MVILLAGASHTGKTLLAQRLLEKYHMPYVSIDHLKMGLIRSGQTGLTPTNDGELTDYVSLREIPYKGTYGRIPGRKGFFYLKEESPGWENW